MTRLPVVGEECIIDAARDAAQRTYIANSGLMLEGLKLSSWVPVYSDIPLIYMVRRPIMHTLHKGYHLIIAQAQQGLAIEDVFCSELRARAGPAL